MIHHTTKKQSLKPHHTILALLSAAAVSFSTACAEDEEAGKPIAPEEVPAAALAAIKKYAGEGKVEKILVEKHGPTTVYEALIKGPGKLVREVAVTKDGRMNSEEKVIPLQEAIRRLSNLPATNLGLAQRGLLKEGYFADAVIFDPKTIAGTKTHALVARLR